MGHVPLTGNNGSVRFVPEWWWGFGRRDTNIAGHHPASRILHSRFDIAIQPICHFSSPVSHVTRDGYVYTASTNLTPLTAF